MKQEDKSFTGIVIIAIGIIIPLLIYLINEKLGLFNFLKGFYFYLYIPVVLLGITQFFHTKEIAGKANTNLFVEYRKWVLFWGLLIDGKEEVQKILDYYNGQNWKVVQFEWQASWKFGLFFSLFALYVNILTFGLIRYWSGFSIIFEGVGSIPPISEESEQKTLEQKELIEWKKNNPGKSINDFFAKRNRN